MKKKKRVRSEYEKQAVVSFCAMFGELQTFIFSFLSAFFTSNLILWADTINAFALTFGLTIAFIIAVKLTKNLRFRYNYGVDKVESLTALTSNAVLFIGLLLILAASVVSLINGPKATEEIIWTGVLLKFVNLSISIVYLVIQIRLYNKNKNQFTKSQLILEANAFAFNLVAFISLLICFILKDVPASYYISPIVSIIIAIYFGFVAVKGIVGTLLHLSDKSIDEEMQKKILESLAKHYDKYEELLEIKTRSTTRVTYVEMYLTFKAEDNYDTIVKLDEELNEELKTFIPNLRLSIVIGKKEQACEPMV